ALAWAEVAANTALELRMNPCSWGGDAASEENTMPVSRRNVLVDAPWRLSTASTRSTLKANGYSSAKAAFRFWPRLVRAMASCCCHTRNASRVFGSNVDR